MWFFEALLKGFAVTIGVEFALGFHYAIKAVIRGNKK